ncbi:MAG: PKD domain-containing protein, partial [bacterium]
TPAVTDHPYRVFFEDGTQGNFDGSAANGWTDPTAPTGQNVMAMGSPKSTVTYTLKVPSATNQIRFGLAIGLSWGQPAQGRGANPGQRQNPIYYLPEFHHKAPWTLGATITNNTLQEGQPTSSADLEIRLRDWQLGATVAAPFTFGDTARDEVAGASELQSLTVYAPGLLASPLDVSVSGGTGTGVYEDRVYTTILTNSGGATEGDYWVWVKAVDSRTPSPTGVIDRNINFVGVGDFHTGFLTQVHVTLPANPPVAVISPNPVVLDCNGPVTLDASGSTDPDAGTLSFEWDFDLVGGNPANFTVDAGPTPTANITHLFTMPYPTHVAVRVTDPTALSAIAVAPFSVNATPIQFGSETQIIANVSPFVDRLGFGNDAGNHTIVSRNGVTYVVYQHFDPFNPGTTNSYRFWKTTTGTSWTPLATFNDFNAFGIAGWWQFSLEVGDNDTLLLFHSEPTSGSNSDWVHRISVCPNGGTGSWTTVFLESAASGLQPDASCAWVDPVNLNTAYCFISSNAGTPRLYRSSAGVAGPYTASTPFGGRPKALDFFHMPNGDSVMLGCWSESGLVGARRSTNGGATWTSQGSFAYASGFGLAYGGGAQNPMDSTGNTMVYAFKEYNQADIQLVRTTDGGTSWTQPQLDVFSSGASASG